MGDAMKIIFIMFVTGLAFAVLCWVGKALADEPRTYTCTGQNGLIVRMTERVGCAPERDVPRAVKALVTHSYEQDKKRGYITEKEMRREIRAELKTYRCGWD